MSEITIEKVTPAKAEAWLNRNRSNRKLRSGVVEKYTADMESDNWTECPTPIAFYSDGEVADGQHRLWAIIESGTTQTFPIFRNLSREAGLNIDTGAGRTIVDNARISGKDTELSTRLISVARAIAEGQPANGGKPMSNQSKLDMVAAHRGAAEFAITVAPKVKLLGNAAVLGAVGRAFYHEKDHDKLRRFCDVLGKGFMESEGESSAIALRNYLLTKGSSLTTSALWSDTFLKVQNAVRYFMLGKKLTIIKKVAEETYPLPKSKHIASTAMRSNRKGR